MVKFDPFSARPIPDQPKYQRATAMPDSTTPSNDAPPRPKRSEKEWQDLVSQQIEEAMRAGAFDNLPGKGKPLDLGKNPNAPADMELANKILKDNDLSPGWIADRKEMLAKIDDLRRRLADAWDRRTPARWTADLARFQSEIDDLNPKIATVNLGMAISRLEIFRLSLDYELKRIGASRQG